jgi:hypothetical protein
MSVNRRTARAEIPTVHDSLMAVVVRLLLLLAAVAVLAASGCSAERPPETSADAQIDKQLRDELLAMLEEDQSERSSGSIGGDRARTERLKEILDEHGWPTWDLVGKKAETAAWAIAQHSDLDLAFQQRALELLREAVARGQASRGNLAYLEDRVAVALGEPQAYGTQIRCGPDGPVPATPIEDPSGVEPRRADAGLEPLTDYLDEMTEICAQPMP